LCWDEKTDESEVSESKSSSNESKERLRHSVEKEQKFFCFLKTEKL